MIYIGLKNKRVPFGCEARRVYRCLSFILTDTAKWDTRLFLELLWRRCGAVIDTVMLSSTYKNPTTGALSHCYRIELWVHPAGSKAGLALDDDGVNDMMAAIEDEMERTLPVHFPSKHRA